MKPGSGGAVRGSDPSDSYPDVAPPPATSCMLKTTTTDVLHMPKTATTGEPDPNDDVEERARDRALDALELPGHGYEMATTRVAIRDAYDYLRGQGQVTAKDFKQDVFPRTGAGTYYTVSTPGTTTTRTTCGRPWLKPHTAATDTYGTFKNRTVGPDLWTGRRPDNAETRPVRTGWKLVGGGERRCRPNLCPT